MKHYTHVNIRDYMASFQQCMWLRKSIVNYACSFQPGMWLRFTIVNSVCSFQHGMWLRNTITNYVFSFGTGKWLRTIVFILYTCTFYSMVCDCATDSSNNDMLTEVSKLYQAGLQNLISTGIYNDKDDFAVVLQPFFRDTEPVKDHVSVLLS